MDHLVFIKNKQAVTTSLQIAEAFSKEHKTVLKAIDGIREGLAQKYANYFWDDTYIHPSNKREFRMVYMNRDGFSLLAMGFTGRKAMDFKVAYISAFNEMEKELSVGYQVPTTFSEALRLAADLEEQNSQLQLENEMQAQVIAEYEPQITYLDQILKSRKTLTVTQIAADYNLTAYRLNQILAEEKVQRKVNNQWILFRRFMNQGYTKSETINIERHGMPDVTMQTRWTQKGRLFIHEILEKRGIYAVMDLEEERV